MSRLARHDVLFEPVRIGPKTLRNRFYQVPHCTGFGVEKPWTQAKHRALKAEGGWASVCTEYCAINPESDEYPFVSARLWDDGDVRALRLMTEGAHEHGALAAVELWHGGIHVEARESRTVPLAPSQIASEFEPLVVPKAMELSDIRRTQDDWVAAALRAREAGFDIVYVYGSHTYLPTQFLSPRYNHRSDAYGGSFENRARFWLETLEKVRAAVGDDCAIAIRIAADTLDGAGIELDEGLAFIRAAEPLVDLFDCVVGGLAGAGRSDAGASRFFDTGYQLEWTSRFREATTKPIVGTGLMVDPDVMADVIQSGVWDLIGAARPSIADPFLPRKIEEGRYDEIRACIGCNACYALANRGRHLGCTQNATAGEEHRRGWHPERFERAANTDCEVLVVGAGPSGLECAIVLAKRGFARVRLVDAADDIGGCMRWIPQLPGLDAWSRFVEWRRHESGRLANLDIETGVRLSAADVRASGAGLVAIATGAHWAADGFNGVTKGPIPGADATLPHMLTPEQIMLGGKAVPGRRVVVLDIESYHLGASLALRLAAEGHEVTIATPSETVAAWCTWTLEGPRLRAQLHGAGVETRVDVAPEAIVPGAVRFRLAHGGDAFDVAADAVVLVTQRLSDEALYLELAGDPHALAASGIQAVYRTGDCVAPRWLVDTVFDGHRLAREIDSPDPDVYLPTLRERVVPA
ncbi:MAG: dimethylamine/trimethylamine dehydrogenase [Gaiellales bacterium]|nr:dimethylamine/trimethylamine dehydrogenase [Gaiellales bacterium]